MIGRKHLIRYLKDQGLSYENFLFELEEMKTYLLSEEIYKIKGLGVFKVFHKNARSGRNPKTKEPFIITARKTIVFHTARTFGSRVAPPSYFTIFRAIHHFLMKGESVHIRGLGRFFFKIRSARQVLDPRNGEKISVPERKYLKFKVSKSFNAAINQKE